MTHEWAVQLTFAGLKSEAELDTLSTDLEAAADASVSMAARLEQWMLTVHLVAETAVSALGDALDLAAKFGQLETPVAAEVCTEIEYERRAFAPTLPLLLGASEVADALAVTRQRVHQLRDNPAFPTPLVEVAMGPLWDAEAIEQFGREWARKPGRPRSA